MKALGLVLAPAVSCVLLTAGPMCALADTQDVQTGTAASQAEAAEISDDQSAEAQNTSRKASSEEEIVVPKSLNLNKRLSRRSQTIQFHQGDKRWAKVHYWGEGGTIKNSGCGLCAYTVAIDMLKDKEYTPPEMLKIRGDWEGTEEYPHEKVGCKGKKKISHAKWTLKKFKVKMKLVSDKVKSVDRALKAKKGGVILLCTSGHNIFHDKNGVKRSSGGHYIVIYAKDAKGRYRVQDSRYKHALGTDVKYSKKQLERMLANSHGTVSMVNA